MAQFCSKGDTYTALTVQLMQLRPGTAGSGSIGIDFGGAARARAPNNEKRPCIYQFLPPFPL